MTIATYVSDLIDIYLFESTGGVSAYGGGAGGLGAGVDYAMEGVNAVDKQVSASEKGFLYDNTTAFTIGADDHFYVWIIAGTPGGIDSRNNRGIVLCLGDGTSDFVKFHVNGVDTLPLGGGNPYAVRFVNTTLTNFRTLVGTPGTTPSWIGGGLNVLASIKFANLGVDGARIGTGYDILNGTGADPEADFAGIATDDESTSEGVFQSSAGGYLLQGKLRIGSSATACEFLEANTAVTVRDTRHSLADFNEIIFEHADTIVNLTNIVFTALGTVSPGNLEMITSAGVTNFTGCSFINWGTTILGTGATFNNCAWVGADIITANGADLIGSSIEGYEGAVDTSPLIWDVATDPDGLLDDMSFTKGTEATHAVEFGLNSPLDITVRGMTMSGFNVANAQNDSTFHFKRTSGTVTLNVVDGAGNFSYKTDGATIVTNINPVTLKITVKDTNLQPIQDVQTSIQLLDSPFTQLMNEDTLSTGIAQEAYTYAGDVQVVWKIRKSDDLDDPRYKADSGIETITGNGLSVTVIMEEQPLPI